MSDPTLPLTDAPGIDTQRRAWRATTGAAVEMGISDLAAGSTKTVQWRRKPVWVLRRTAQMLSAPQGQEARLADPQSAKDRQPGYVRNASRSLQPEPFVAVGICTHLEVPPHRYLSDTRIVIGEDGTA